MHTIYLRVLTYSKETEKRESWNIGKTIKTHDLKYQSTDIGPDTHARYIKWLMYHVKPKGGGGQATKRNLFTTLVTGVGVLMIHD